MIDAQAARLAQMQNDEEERVERQVAQKEASDEAKRLAKEEARCATPRSPGNRSGHDGTPTAQHIDL